MPAPKAIPTDPLHWLRGLQAAERLQCALDKEEGGAYFLCPWQSPACHAVAPGGVRVGHRPGPTADTALSPLQEATAARDKYIFGVRRVAVDGGYAS